MRSYGRGFVTAVDPYRDNPPDEDGDVVCVGCGAVFPGLDELRAAGLLAYPERCRECRAEDQRRAGAGRSRGDSGAFAVDRPFNNGPRAAAPAVTR